MNAPEHYTRLATAKEVDTQIDRVAKEILTDAPDKSPLFVGLLRGAAPFTSKLMSGIVAAQPDYHPELDYMMVSTYGSGREAGEPHIVTDLAPSTIVQGRDVIIVDDVLDKGITADFVTKHLRNRGAAVIRLAVLCDKRAQRRKDVEANYVGFTFDDNWLVGMGMDNSEEAVEGYRWIQEIWELTQN
jgi:hypoxanthine phosphoribosyltransferase